MANESGSSLSCEIKAHDGKVEHVCEYSIGYYVLPPSYGMGWDYHSKCDPPSQEQIELCKSWISNNCKPRKTINRTAHSYGLKHDVERDVGKYISNGAFIRAAIELGYKYKVKSPNALFAMTFLLPTEEKK
jgi:hypothetical protein